jgi:hypothetical protein
VKIDQSNARAGKCALCGYRVDARAGMRVTAGGRYSTFHAACARGQYGPATPAGPLGIACDECGAGPGEPCRPYCIGEAAHNDAMGAGR